jgi:hypothetical protein
VGTKPSDAYRLACHPGVGSIPAPLPPPGKFLGNSPVSLSVRVSFRRMPPETGHCSYPNSCDIHFPMELFRRGGAPLGGPVFADEGGAPLGKGGAYPPESLLAALARRR